MRDCHWLYTDPSALEKQGSQLQMRGVDALGKHHCTWALQAKFSMAPFNDAGNMAWQLRLRYARMKSIIHAPELMTTWYVCRRGSLAS